MTILFDGNEFRRALGDEMRKGRKKRGLIRREIPPLLCREVSEQTVATYELGTRHVSVVNFVDYCLAVDESPMDVLRNAYARVIDPSERDGWDVDLAAAARLYGTQLEPLAAWATTRMASPEHPRVAHLDRAAIMPLATLCGIGWADLVRRLPEPGYSGSADICDHTWGSCRKAHGDSHWCRAITPCPSHVCFWCSANG